MYAVYIYELNGRAIYVGKTTSNLQKRINCHTNEAKFLPFSDASIYYAELKNSTEATIYELALINNYKPILNESNVYENTRRIPIDESLLKWKSYDDDIERKPLLFLDNNNKGEDLPEDLKKEIEELQEQREKQRLINKYNKLKTKKPRTIKLPDIYKDKGKWSVFKHNKTGRVYQKYSIKIGEKRRQFYGKTQEEAFYKYLKALEKASLSGEIDNETKLWYNSQEE